MNIRNYKIRQPLAVATFCLLIITIYCLGNRQTVAASAENSDLVPEITNSLPPKDACNIRAYSIDKDPNGTNVRAKADKTSPVLKLLKTPNEIVYTISGFSGGWFEISKVEETGTDDEKVLFEGSGWVHSSLLGMDVAAADPVLYKNADRKSRVLKKLVADATPVKLIGCRGDWAKVQTGKLIGWLSRDGQCANPLTTCS